MIKLSIFFYLLVLLINVACSSKSLQKKFDEVIEIELGKIDEFEYAYRFKGLDKKNT